MTAGRDTLSRRGLLGAGMFMAGAVALGTAASTGAAAAPVAAARTSAPPGSEPGASRNAALKRVDYVCNMCGGNMVTRDAWAEWDSDERRWVLGAAYDYAFCHDCEEETKLVEVDLATREPTGD